jgi:protein-tyrosine-phosphatase/DNA-binding transcriptional ArsR family regulator
MELSSAATLFATLGHPDRLAVLRLLLRRLPDGVRPGEIAAFTGLRPSTLAAHLDGLVQAGLVTARRKGRAVFYRAEAARLGWLATYLAADCARGRVTVPQPEPLGRIMSKTYTVLFICTGNSARSIMAEAILAQVGAGKFKAFSAGTRPTAEVNPTALAVLEHAGHPTAGLRSKGVEEFRGPDAPRLDFVFTVCDRAAAEECPPWPGQPITAHWGLPDPVKATGTEAEKAQAFNSVYAAMRRRILAFTALPFETLDRMSLQSRLDSIAEV